MSLPKNGMMMLLPEAPSNVTANDRVPRNDADLSQPVAMDEQSRRL